MDLFVIADDLTGANDTGVQYTKFGYTPAVVFQKESLLKEKNRGVYIYDTDSRSLRPEEAYKAVYEAVKIVEEAVPKTIYKKIDSTLRGNIGSELDALFAAGSSDFIVVNPAFPENGREVREGNLYVHGVPLADTDIQHSPGQRFQSSFLHDIISEQSVHQSHHLTQEQFKEQDLLPLLQELKKKGIVYLTLDYHQEQDIKSHLQKIKDTEFQFMWAGSAGLAGYLPDLYQFHRKKEVQDDTDLRAASALFIIGSRSSVTQKQLDTLLREKIVHYALDPEIFFTSGWKSDPLIVEMFKRFAEDPPHNLCISLQNTEKHVQNILHIVENKGWTMEQGTKFIAASLGELVRKINEHYRYKSLVMTGGDISKAVCQALDVTSFVLNKELESGIPIGRLEGKFDPIAITKAGAFGKEDTFVHALNYLRGTEKDDH